MKFATQDAQASAGWQLAQAVLLDGRRLGKGTTLSAAQAKALGALRVQVYQLEPEDLSEDEAAKRLQTPIFGPSLKLSDARTGRVNALAEEAGLVIVDSQGVARFNGAGEALTLATLPPLQRVEAGDLVATLKIIPFGVHRSIVEAAEPDATLVKVQPLRPKSISLIQTKPEAVQDRTLDKARDALSARLSALGSTIREEHRVDHRHDAVAQALQHCRGELIVIFPGAATQDRRDVGPAGLVAAGGRVVHLGMPVDPGNLLFIGQFGETPVIGAPGCARSVAFNGFDWVLERACADLFPSARDIQGLGVGGLLKEIPSRPLPRLKA